MSSKVYDPDDVTVSFSTRLPQAWPGLIGVQREYDESTWLGCIMQAARTYIVGAHVLETLTGYEFTYMAQLPGRIHETVIAGTISV